MPHLRSYTAGPAASDVLLDPSFHYREELLQFVWEQRLFEPRNLITVEGEEVQVIRPGRLHQHSGPDLVEAQVCIGGQLWAGNVEVHIRSSDWYAHGHQNDPAYNGVVLHVVYEHDLDVRTLAGARIPTVELRSRVPAHRLDVYMELMRKRAWVPCASQFAHADLERVPFWLERLLIERLQRRSQEVERLYHGSGGDALATFWHLLARGFGSKVNAEPFGMLARALPLKVLFKYRDDLIRTEALLFGQAGLLRTDFLDEYPRALQHEHRSLSLLHGLGPVPVAAWQFGRLRPPNFPTVRIAQLALIIQRSEGSFASILEENEPERILELLNVEASGYWLSHHRFDQASAPSPKRLGSDARNGLIINAIVPYLFAMGRIRDDARMQERAIGLLERLPPEKNTVLQGWTELGLKADSAARGQALLELKNSYCGQRRCLSCVIGTDLLKRNAP